MTHLISVWVRKGHFIFCRVKSERTLHVYLNVSFYGTIGEPHSSLSPVKTGSAIHFTSNIYNHAWLYYSSRHFYLRSCILRTQILDPCRLNAFVCKER